MASAAGATDGIAGKSSTASTRTKGRGGTAGGASGMCCVLNTLERARCSRVGGSGVEGAKVGVGEGAGEALRELELRERDLPELEPQPSRELREREPEREPERRPEDDEPLDEEPRDDEPRDDEPDPKPREPPKCPPVDCASAPAPTNHAASSHASPITTTNPRRIPTMLPADCEARALLRQSPS